MNNYPQWWNQTVTVYNRIEDPQTRVVTWHRTVIPKCFWRYTQEKFVVDGTVVNANVTICRIPKQSTYLERYLWEQRGNDISKYFTLSIGDIIVKGNVADEINEYASGKRSTDLLNKYKRLQGCTLIASVSDNTDGGRGAEHYLIRGN